ncbi:transcriptional regulator [Actinoplanes italicus]|uniref:Transcriptional regulator GlxA family with amidase domain n=1 Tax=Actinoplanes italicus TaxID=113567 RepID=A0A2T0JWF5_9ACTN|nr:GlxA family transcriptional regulator [Actinoplanes italicus]PRX12041.1 transcriptional regulator GlxA family with amidase domain [Actinoplanes italicus]GIE30888.1 transcriptional regulator [Actinoplanes italicus]
MTVLILLFDGVQSLDVTGPLEVFTGAGYRVVTASPGGAPVRTSSGLTIVPDSDLCAAPLPATVVVPGGEGTRATDPDVVAWLRRHGGSVPRVMSVCSGAFLLAEAGLLSGRRVTTHWSVCGALARRFPDVDVDPEPIFVRDGPIATSAGVTAGIDLALALVEEDHGRDTALLIARHLVMFLRRPANQTQFSAQLSAQVAARPGLREVQRWIADNPAADLSVPELARRANLSPRQFARTFTAEVGQSPGRYVDATRLETARRLLEDRAAGAGAAGVEQIARATGYGTAEAMRRAFVRVLGVTPSEYQRRLSPVPKEV